MPSQGVTDLYQPLAPAPTFLSSAARHLEQLRIE